MRYLIILMLWFVAWGKVWSQSNPWSNLRYRTLSLDTTWVTLDTLAIVPGSLEVLSPLDSACVEVDAFAAQIRLNPKCQALDELRIRYRVFQYAFNTPYTSSKFTYDSLRVFKSYTNTQTGSFNALQFKSLDYSGAYSRSIMAGNSQSLSLNSNFNMQVSGYLFDSIRIEGAITDNQLPFQPDGNTQRIQEFDRLYLIFEKGQHKITLGDYNLGLDKSCFLKFNKRVQGAFYQAQSLKTGNIEHTLGISGSIAKGQFARNTFNGIEGNQGPYKLVGNNGEQFFIILAGTEKVYIDGYLMERGEDRDYIINYNTGEITFMPRVLITKDKRIQVEFEYQDRNYLNSLFYVYDKIQVNDKLSFFVNFYSNQDAKNQPYLQEIDDDKRRFLRDIGDNIDQAYYQMATPETFGPNKILYIKKDTLVDGIWYTDIYEYSMDSTQELYSLGFSYVGENKGNYVVSGENTNGRSYAWVPPIAGIPQGAYEPVVLLVTPKMHQVLTVSGTYQIDTFKTLSLEGSFSRYDPNLFSPVNDNEHSAFALRGIYSEKRRLNKSDSIKNKSWWHNTLSYEFVQSKYKAISPYRNVEFFRDWNVISSDSIAADEHIVQYQTKLEKEQLGNIQYEFARFTRGDIYSATRNVGSLEFLRKNTRAGLKLNLMQSRSPITQSHFFRPSLYAEHTFSQLDQFTLGIIYEQEHNQIRIPNSDALKPEAFSFDVYQAYIRGGKAEDFTYGVHYRYRKDKGVKDETFVNKNAGHNVDFNVNVQRWKNHQLDLTAGYRKLETFDSTFIATEAPGETVVGRLNYNGNFGKQFFTPTLLYELGSGQEQKRSYTYVEVPPGQGVYYWVDYNGDGVQQANEFEIGIYPDQKRYIRIITPNNEYVKVNYYRINLSFGLNGAQLFDRDKRDKGLAKIISRISDQFSMDLNNRVTSDAGLRSFSPFFTQYEDTQIIAYSQNLINTFFFNRQNPKWGFEYITTYNATKLLLTFGPETSSWMRHNLQFRAMLNKSWSTTLRLKSAYRSYYSGVNDGRTYHYDSRGINPSITTFIGSKVRITAQYDYDYRRNKTYYGNEKAIIHSAGIDSRFSFKTLGSIQFGSTVSIIKFDGNEDSGVGIAMLDALKKGSNFLWNLQWNTKISKGLEFSLQYDGRKPGSSRVIHTASMSLRALL